MDQEAFRLATSLAYGCLILLGLLAISVVSFAALRRIRGLQVNTSQMIDESKQLQVETLEVYRESLAAQRETNQLLRELIARLDEPVEKI
jgi:hypothetical protein